VILKLVSAASSFRASESILAYIVVHGQVWQGSAKYLIFLILWLRHVNFEFFKFSAEKLLLLRE
jgi:hypothetical protein